MSEIRMVDISDKKVVNRIAEASAKIFMAEETINLIKTNKLPKGDCLTCAKVSAIQASKKTYELIPLCHPIPIDNIDLEFNINKNFIEVKSKVVSEAKTGVEMEALTAVSVACLTIYDMCKQVDKNMRITDVYLIKKEKKIEGERIII